jgi:hypothetical protein
MSSVPVGTSVCHQYQLMVPGEFVPSSRHGWHTYANINTHTYQSVFQGASIPANSAAVGDVSVFKIVPERTSAFSLPATRRDPTAFGFQLHVESQQGNHGGAVPGQWLYVKLCTKDQGSRRRWLVSIRTRALGKWCLRTWVWVRNRLVCMCTCVHVHVCVGA